MLLTRLKNFLLGARPGFGLGLISIERASEAALRRPQNWILPGLFGLCICILSLMISFKATDLGGAWLLIMRIILFDYLIFFFGWICGWSTAWRWRKNQSFIEEMVVTNLRPAVVGNLLFAGSLSIWLLVLMLVGVVDFFGISISWFLKSDPGFEPPLVETGLILVLSVVYVPMLAWFHLETLRIAYWMFATAALPRVNLSKMALANFFLIPLYVFLLTALGSMLTGIMWFLAAIFMTLFNPAAPDSAVLSHHVPWMIASVPGLLAIALFKRLISGLYQSEFQSSFLLFTWWGAGETEQPRKYPLELTQHVMMWLGYLKTEEAAIAAGKEPPEKTFGRPVPTAPKSPAEESGAD